MPITEDDLDDLLTPAEVAARLHVARSTVYRMIELRQIDTVRIGSGRGRRRITRRALLDYVNRSVDRADHERELPA